LNELCSVIDAWPPRPLRFLLMDRAGHQLLLTGVPRGDCRLGPGRSDPAGAAAALPRSASGSHFHVLPIRGGLRTIKEAARRFGPGLRASWSPDSKSGEVLAFCIGCSRPRPTSRDLQLMRLLDISPIERHH
jgi:hypothetical protein